MSKDSDEYYTPQWIFKALNIKFDLDVSAPKNGVPWLPAQNHYSIEDNGLTQDWYGKVWMNPPYSKPTPWINRFIEHGNGVALLPFMKSKWFELIWEKADLIVALPTNLKFEHREMGLKPIYSPCFIASIGSYCTDYLKQSGIGRMR
jgi:phage N-6-adenine-methyltransferase